MEKSKKTETINIKKAEKPVVAVRKIKLAGPKAAALAAYPARCN